LVNNFKAVHNQLNSAEALINSVPVKTKVAELALRSASKYVALASEWVSTAEKREKENNV
jgi:hypothetical protein